MQEVPNDSGQFTMPSKISKKPAMFSEPHEIETLESVANTLRHVELEQGNSARETPHFSQQI